jgi:hypothetical protein
MRLLPDPRQGRIVELRFFGGLTEDEIAEVLGVAAITVKRTGGLRGPNCNANWAEAAGVEET